MLSNAQDIFKTIVAVGTWATGVAGGLPIEPKAYPDYKKIVKDWRRLRKWINPISISLGFYTYKVKALAEQYDGILAKYTELHMATAQNPYPTIAQGMFVIKISGSVWSGVPGASGNFASYNYYDIATRQYIGTTNY